MRGARVGIDPSGWGGGIIPADAGSTNTNPYYDYPWEDHPRRCGEHQYRSRIRIHLRGSSPQMRGAPRVDHVGRSDAGIIPADAGSTVFFMCYLCITGIIPADAGSTPCLCRV